MTKHPIEVITSVERRRRWSREEKEGLVAACLEPDAVIEIARTAGIHVSQLFRWRKELCRIEEPQTETGTVLVPVIVSEAASTASPVQAESPTTSHLRRKRSDVMIELGRGRRVHIDSDIDKEALGRILDCVLGLR